MNLGRLAAIVRGEWRWAVAVWAAVIVLVMLASLVIPRQYTAQAAVVVDLKAPDLLNAHASPAASWIPGYVATQVDVLRSERVAIKAIDRLGLDRDPLWRERWMDKTDGEGDLKSWLATELHRKIDIKPSREGSTIHVAVTARTPRGAADLANALVQGYVETVRELRIEPVREFAGFFDERARRLRSELEAAQARLSAFQRETGILARDERLDVETARLNELSNQLVTVQSLAAETSGRRAQAQADPQRSLDVQNNPLVASLTTDIHRQQARLEELTSRLGDAHPQVIEARGSLESLRGRLAAVSAQISGGVQATDAVSRNRVARLESALAEQRQKVLQLKSKRDEIDVLVRDVENAQRAYDLVLARGSQTALESQNAQTNVGVIKTATEPGRPSMPILWLNALLATLGGALLALGTVIVREQLNRRLRSAEDILTELDLPVLGEMPDSTRHTTGATASSWAARRPGIPLSRRAA